jgi:hypothetical protein
MTEQMLYIQQQIYLFIKELPFCKNINTLITTYLPTYKNEIRLSINKSIEIQKSLKTTSHRDEMMNIRNRIYNCYYNKQLKDEDQRRVHLIMEDNNRTDWYMFYGICSMVSIRRVSIN